MPPRDPGGSGGVAIRAVLFDKDGTLVDFHATWTAAYRGAAKELATLAGGGSRLADDLLRRHGYDPATEKFSADSPLLWATCAEQAQRWSREPELAAITGAASRIERHFEDRRRYPQVPLIDLPVFLRGLRQRKLGIGIASMDRAQAIDELIDATGSAGLIDFVAGCDSGYGLKPHPGMVHYLDVQI